MIEEEFLNNMTDDEKKLHYKMIEAMKDMIEEEKRELQENQKILEIVKSKVSEKVFEDIKWSLAEGEHTFNYKITDKPKGKFQKELDFEELDGQWVNQTTNGGFTGDEFAGTISIKLNDKEFFEFSYSM